MTWSNYQERALINRIDRRRPPIELAKKRQEKRPLRTVEQKNNNNEATANSAVGTIVRYENNDYVVRANQQIRDWCKRLTLEHDIENEDGSIVTLQKVLEISLDNGSIHQRSYRTL